MSASISEKLLGYIKATGMTASRIYSIAGIDRFRGYDIVHGIKRGQRDELIRLSIALMLSPEQTQELLNASGVQPLDADDQRDSAILFALKQGGDIDGLNEALFDLGVSQIT